MRTLPQQCDSDTTGTTETMRFIILSIYISQNARSIDRVEFRRAQCLRDLDAPYLYSGNKCSSRLSFTIKRRVYFSSTLKRR